MAPVNELNGAVYDTFATNIIYAKLFPLIVDDFMGKLDCKLVHITGNMIANTTGSPAAQSGPVLHLATQGGSDKISQATKLKYEAALKVGDVLSLVTG